jgi:hypothetical protein
MSALQYNLRLIISSIVFLSLPLQALFAAEGFVGGRVLDAITKRPVAGADVYVEYASQKIGSGKTETDGVYQVPFAIPPSAQADTWVTVTAGNSDHGPKTLNVRVTGGQSAGAFDIEIFPAGLLECLSKSDHSVIVGSFLPPVSAGAMSDLSRRIAISLEFALKTRLQAVHLTLAKQPSFEPCEPAKPTTTKLGANYAKALKADAFVAGDVTHEAGVPGYSVSFYVSDAYDFFADPQVASNPSINLNSPSGASVSDATHAAVLTSIAAGLAKKNDCLNSIKVLNVAEKLMDSIPPDLKSLRKECDLRLPNIDLRRNTP